MRHAHVMNRIKANAIQKSLKDMISNDIDYRETLYLGIMLVDNEPKILEFNVRLGYPECQVLL